MSTDTVHDEPRTPGPQFEDRLLATILDEFDALATTTPRVTRHRSRRLAWAAVPALAAAAAAAVAVAIAAPIATRKPVPHRGTGSPGHLVVISPRR